MTNSVSRKCNKCRGRVGTATADSGLEMLYWKAEVHCSGDSREGQEVSLPIKRMSGMFTKGWPMWDQHYPYWLVSGLSDSASRTARHSPHTNSPHCSAPLQARPLTWRLCLPHWTLPHTTAGLLAMSFTCPLSPAVNLFAQHNTDMGFNCFP